MEAKNWVTAVFSPTGTTEKIAKAVMQGAGKLAYEIDLSAPVGEEKTIEKSILLAAAPVYGGRIPGVALDRLKNIKGNGEPAVALAVYGNREYDDALLELKDALETGGFQVVAAAAFIAEHSIVRSIAAGRPNEVDLTIAKEFGASVAEKLAKSGEEVCAVQVPGNPEYKEYKGLPFHPKGNHSCTSCGICAEKCPVGAIPKENPAQTYGDKCITCMRCVGVCPVKARTLSAPAILGATAMLKTCAGKPKEPVLFL